MVNTSEKSKYFRQHLEKRFSLCYTGQEIEARVPGSNIDK